MTHTQVKELVQALLDARTSNPTVKEFAQSWLDAEGTPKQEELTKQLVSVAEQKYRPYRRNNWLCRLRSSKTNARCRSSRTVIATRKRH